jgi:uracil-DNA glycosylase
MSRRRLILEEIGITPLWRLDAGRPPAAQGEPPPAKMEPAAANAAPSAERSLASDPGTAKEAALDAGGAGAQTDDRRARILRMDWEPLKAAVAQCTACPLHEKRTNTVFGVGDEEADWMFVGEGPGAEEDAKGEPFVGQAGRLLDNMLAAAGMKRGEDVYIANVVKCRPPGNRNPEPGEMHRCEPYLARQIMLIRPKLIIAMGRVAASHLLDTTASIASLRGRVHFYQGTPLIVTYHPAYLLRNLPDKAKAWVDLCFARDTMAQLRKKSA